MPNHRPWFPLYVSDHLRLGLDKLCSAAATGLYLRLAFIAHDAPRFGYICNAVGPIQESDLARICGITNDEYANLSSELIRIRGIVKTADGLLCLPLMVSLEQSTSLTRQKEREKKQRQRFSGLCPGVPLGTGDTSVDSDSENDSAVNRRSRTELLINAYPRKHNREKTVTAIAKALRETSFEVLQIAVERFADDMRDTPINRIKTPEKWFTQSLWRNYVDEKWKPNPKVEKPPKSESVTPSQENIPEEPDLKNGGNGHLTGKIPARLGPEAVLQAEVTSGKNLTESEVEKQFSAIVDGRCAKYMRDIMKLSEKQISVAFRGLRPWSGFKLGALMLGIYLQKDEPVSWAMTAHKNKIPYHADFERFEKQAVNTLDFWEREAQQELGIIDAKF